MEKNIAIGISIIVVLFVLGGVLVDSMLLQTNVINQENSMVQEDNQEQVTELEVVDTVVGTGEEVVSGDTVSVHYTGMLTTGAVFDSSVQRGVPFEFTVGEGRVIQGWEQGLLGMKVGGKRTLVIPSALGYGPAGAPGVIPPNSTLIFEIELLDIK